MDYNYWPFCQFSFMVDGDSSNSVVFLSAVSRVCIVVDCSIKFEDSRLFVVFVTSE